MVTTMIQMDCQAPVLLLRLHVSSYFEKERQGYTPACTVVGDTHLEQWLVTYPSL